MRFPVRDKLGGTNAIWEINRESDKNLRYAILWF